MSNPTEIIEQILLDPGICDSGEIPNELLEHFHSGYPVENLRRLLANRNEKIVKAGIFIASELGSKAAPLVNDVAKLLSHRDVRVRFDAIDSMLTCTTGQHEAQVAAVVLMLNDSAGPVRRKALDFLSRASEDQLQGAFRFLQKNELGSAHLPGLQMLLGSGARETDTAMSFLRNENPLLKKYGVVAATRMVTMTREPLLFAASLDDPDVSTVAKNVLELMQA